MFPPWTYLVIASNVLFLVLSLIILILSCTVALKVKWKLRFSFFLLLLLGIYLVFTSYFFEKRFSEAETDLDEDTLKWCLDLKRIAWWVSASCFSVACAGLIVWTVYVWKKHTGEESSCESDKSEDCDKSVKLTKEVVEEHDREQVKDETSMKSRKDVSENVEQKDTEKGENRLDQMLENSSTHDLAKTGSRASPPPKQEIRKRDAADAEDDDLSSITSSPSLASEIGKK